MKEKQTKIDKLESFIVELKEEFNFEELEGMTEAQRDDTKGGVLAIMSIHIYTNWLKEGAKVSSKKDADTKVMTEQELIDIIESRQDIYAVDQQLVNAIEERPERMLMAQRRYLIEFQEEVKNILNG